MKNDLKMVARSLSKNGTRIKRKETDENGLSCYKNFIRAYPLLSAQSALPFPAQKRAAFLRQPFQLFFNRLRFRMVPFFF